MSSQPPRRRRKKTSQSSGEGGELPRRRKKGTGKKKKKNNSKSPATLLAMIGIPVAAVLVIGSLIFFVDWSGLSQTFGGASPLEGFIQNAIVSTNKEIEILKTVTDKASAESSSEPLKELYIERSKITNRMIEHMLEKQEEYKKEHPDTNHSGGMSQYLEQMKKDSEAFMKSQKEEQDALKKKYQPEVEESKRRKNKEMTRINKIPELKVLMQDILQKAQAEGLKLSAEFLKKRMDRMKSSMTTP